MPNTTGHYQIFTVALIRCKAPFLKKKKKLIENRKTKRREKTATNDAFNDASVGVTPGFTHSQEPPQPHL